WGDSAFVAVTMMGYLPVPAAHSRAYFLFVCPSLNMLSGTERNRKDTQMNKLHIIVGSTRDGRAAEPVAQWVHRRAKEHGGFDVTLLDLRDWPLPMFAETMAKIGDFSSPSYSDPIERRCHHI